MMAMTRMSALFEPFAANGHEQNENGYTTRLEISARLLLPAFRGNAAEGKRDHSIFHRWNDAGS